MFRKSLAEHPCYHVPDRLSVLHLFPCLVHSHAQGVFIVLCPPPCRLIPATSASKHTPSIAVLTKPLSHSTQPKSFSFLNTTQFTSQLSSMFTSHKMSVAFFFLFPVLYQLFLQHFKFRFFSLVFQKWSMIDMHILVVVSSSTMVQLEFSLFLVGTVVASPSMYYLFLTYWSIVINLDEDIPLNTLPLFSARKTKGHTTML